MIAWLGESSSARAATMLFSDGFESGNHALWWDWNYGTVDTSKPHSGLYSANYDESSSGTLNNETHLSNPNNSKTGYTSFWSWFPVNYNFNPPANDPGHWLRFWSPTWSSQLDHLMSLNYYALDIFSGCVSGTCAYDHGTLYSSPFPFGSIADGKWHHTEVLFNEGDVNVPNGFYKIWMDGVPIADWTNLLMRVENQDLVGGDYDLPSNGGNPQPGVLKWLDDIEVWDGCPAVTQFSGVPSCAGRPDITPPAAPGGLKIR